MEGGSCPRDCDKTDNELDSVYKEIFKTVIGGKLKQFGGIRESSNIRIVSTFWHKEFTKGIPQ